MLKMILYGFLFYFLYKVIFEIVVPVSKGVKNVRSQMEQMQSQARQNAENQQFRENTASKPTSESPKAEDYIDFEEVKNK
jgi:Sec-independent protein translocase protein TatA